MELPIIDTAGKQVGKKELPIQFSEEPRPDMIKRAVEVVQANRRQPYGAKPTAGKRSSAKISRRRRNFKTAYGKGVSRVPRKTMSRRGMRFNWRGAFAPGTVGGRRAFPPTAEKDLSQKINTKERRKAIRSAIAYTINKAAVSKRGHKIPPTYPFILSAKFEEIAKTKDMFSALTALGFSEELVRGEEKKIRAGRGKHRGRPYRKTKSLLLVFSKNAAATKAARNIPGIDVVVVNNLNADLLAPGAMPGRATLFSEAAIERLDKERLFQ